MTSQLRLRRVLEDDLVEFFLYQQDPEATRMAAFVAKDPSDRREFAGHWARVLTNPANRVRTVEVDGEVVGYVSAFPVEDQTEVSYWIDRERWGRGYATAALAALLREVPRPVHARAAKDNAASLAVLRKCGFVVVGEDSGYANGRGEDVEEWLLELPADAPDLGGH
ncbi:GNAT family N-acetyltransferase [Micromonospora sp. NPDC049175]|uniref:GNAT family N-acetyltransferase n=1 Tax=Micromonospora sp. NPDC049175 TaxID=3364266 RepID=UPI0037129393